MLCCYSFNINAPIICRRTSPQQRRYSTTSFINAGTRPQIYIPNTVPSSTPTTILEASNMFCTRRKRAKFNQKETGKEYYLDECHTGLGSAANTYTHTPAHKHNHSTPHNITWYTILHELHMKMEKNHHSSDEGLAVQHPGPTEERQRCYLERF
jgi:hypothetical protein